MVREHKNRPVEVSAKKRVSVLRNVVPPVRKKAIDPRFDRTFGHFNEDMFSKSYGFIGEMQEEERRLMQKSLRGGEDPATKAAIKKVLDRMSSAKKSKEKSEQRQRLLREHRKMEAKLVAQGKTPFFIKRDDLSKLELAEEFEQLQKRVGSGANMDRFIEKKLKRKASKQRRFIPRAASK